MHLRLFLRSLSRNARAMQSPTYLSRRTHASAMPLERKKVGEVFHFYGKIGVAAIRLTDDGIAIGDTVQIQGPDEPGADRGDVADRAHRRLAGGPGPRSRDEGPRARAGEGLRLQARSDGSAAPGTARESAFTKKSSTDEEGTRQEGTTEEEGAR